MKSRKINNKHIRNSIYLAKSPIMLSLRKLFKDKSKEQKIDSTVENEIEFSGNSKKESKLMDSDYSRNKLFKKGIAMMADEKMEEAAQAFEDALRIDPGHVDSLLKLGYARFHMDDHSRAMEAYNKVHQIDVTNADAWNLKGLIFYRQKNYEKDIELQKINEYDIIPKLAEKIGVEKKGLLGTKKKSPILVQHLKEISEAIQAIRTSIEKGDVKETITNLDVFIDPAKKGSQMIEYFFEEHREIRLYKIRLSDRGYEYLQANKQKILDLFDSIESTVTTKLRSAVAQN